MKSDDWNPMMSMPEGRSFEVYHVVNQDAYGMPVFHTHEYYEFYVYIAGSIHLSVEDRLYTPAPYSLFVYPPGVPHCWLPNGMTGRYERAYFYLSRSFIDAVSTPAFPFNRILEKSIQQRYGFLLGYEKGSALTAQMDEIIHSHMLTNPADQMLNHYRICMLLVSVCRLFTENREETASLPMRVRDIIFYINDHISQDITLDFLAQRFFISKYYLLHIFKEYTGMSVHQYIIHKRITYARNLIHGNMSPGDAARLSGFNDYAGFYRTFTKIVGTTPQAFYRERSAAAAQNADASSGKD